MNLPGTKAPTGNPGNDLSHKNRVYRLREFYGGSRHDPFKVIFQGNKGGPRLCISMFQTKGIRKKVSLNYGKTLTY